MADQPFPASSSKSLFPNAMPEPSRPADINGMVDETVHLPNGDLSLSQKLVKALILVLSGLHRNVADAEPAFAKAAPRRPLSATTTSSDEAILPPGAWPLPSPSRGEAAPPAPPASPPSPTWSPASIPMTLPASLAGLNTTQYSDLLEVLASALRDASSAPWLWGPEPTFSPAPPTGLGGMHDFMIPSGFGLADFCADPLSMPSSLPPPPPPPLPVVSVSGPSPDPAVPAGPAPPPAASEIIVRDLPSLLFENLNDLVSLLKPLPTAAPTPTAGSPLLSPNMAVTAPSSPRPISPPLPGSVVPSTTGKKKTAPINTLPSEMLSRILALARVRRDATACECEHPCMSSRGATQRWALTLLLVCRDWKAASTYAAYSSVRLRRRSQISGLVKLVRQRPDLSEIIADVDIKVPGLQGPGGPSAGGPGAHPYLGHPRHGSRRAAAFPWLSPPDKRGVSLSPSEADDQLVSTLVNLCPALSKLELNVAKPGFSYTSWAYGADFLEQGLERAMGASPCLRALTLRACIDFCELEAVLTSCSTIEVLRLEGGVDNLDGADDALTEPHKCRLKEFFLNSWESSELGEAQLCWMLTSSVGTLARLEVATSVGLTAAGLAGGNPFPPFSGFAFAELLVELAPTLVRLALKDSLGQGPGLGQGNPTLRQPPHDGHFDYALARCGKLRELALEWAYTGQDLLASLEGKPIEALALLGAPNGHTTARDLATRLTTSFGKLDRLALAHFPLHQIAPGWSARDVRHLRRACQERQLQLEFSTI